MGVIASAVHAPLEMTPANWHILYLPESEQTAQDLEQNAD